MENPSTSRERHRALGLLAVGAAAGLLLASLGLLGSDSASGGLPDSAVARVNDVLILADDYQRLLAALESDLRRPADAEDRRHVLDRMIEEELLVQRGIELGLTRHDRRVRGDLVSAVIAAITAEVDELEPDPEELRAFYADERGFFARPGRLRVQQLFLRVPDPESEEKVLARAREARARIASGEPFERVRAELGDEGVLAVPDALLPPIKLREYLGPSALQVAQGLDVGATSEPLRSSGGLQLIRLVEREPGSTPPLEAVAAEVRAEWVRRAGDRALRRYLDELRDRADVELATEAR